MSRDDFSDASSEEVPDDDTTIVTTHCEECAPSVKGTRHSDTHAVQRSLKVLSGESRPPALTQHRLLLLL